MSLIIDEHRQYLADASRTSSYRAAITQVVRPGDVVVDLGSGTGILGLLACAAGASRVYAIDAGGMAEPARAIARANGFGNRVTVIDGWSRHVELPERADVLVTDQVGHFGFEAGIVPNTNHARRCLLKPAARLVPSHIDLWVAPIEAPEVDDAIDFWSRRPAGFDMSPLHDMAANSGYPREILPGELLGTAVRGGSMDLADDNRLVVVSAESRIERAGTLSGIGGWFSATLAPGVTMSNSPLAADRIGRRCVVLPIARPTAVAPGDRVKTVIRILPDDVLVSWIVELFRGDASVPADRFSHTTLRGMLIEPEKLRRTHPEYVPSLNARGEARRSVLELCDGRRTIDEIEQATYDRHRPIFRDRVEASVFVAEVTVGYSR